jgi:metal-responsive CopG/Arc/MetJ family transcriptional regulator
MKQERLQIVIPKWLKDELKQAADDKSISMSEFIKDSLKSILDREKQSKTNAD